ncbi:hypothetical protein HY947_03670 [Candidatus Gottesmanbacteria bacterium]|nr:hypothetical protein [Candidatus Gottesmanbacteria bacterium]
MNKDENLSTVIKILVGLCVIIGIILLSLFVYKTYQKNKASSLARTSQLTTNDELLSPTPSPVPLPKGKQSFTVNGAKKNGITWMSVVVDPYDPGLNSNQAMTVKMTSDTPVTSLTVQVASDTKKTPYQLQLASGSGSEGTWQASWTVNDTHEINYSAIITAENSQGGDTLTLTFR